MKLPFSLILMAVLAVSGCKPATGPTPPLAPGYTNQVDQTMGQTLAAAHAFYQTLQQDTVAGNFFPSPAEKTALNALAASLNVAQPIYIAYHNGTATQAQAQAAVADVVQKQSTLQSQIGAL